MATGGDPIRQLPVDQLQPTPEELQIVNTIFKTHKTTMDKVIAESKDALLVGVLFIALSLPQADDLVNKYIPISTTSTYMTLLIKALAIIIFYWVFKYFYLSRKS